MGARESNMKEKRELALAVISLLLIALIALSGCGPKNDSAPTPPSPEDVWLQAYHDVQNTGRPSKAYQAIDLTRALYFDGHATIQQTQERIYMILKATPGIRLTKTKTKKYIALLTDPRPQFRNLSAYDIRRRYVR